MILRCFADHCVPNSIIQDLLADGHDVLRLRDHIPPDSPDVVVLSTAQTFDALLISLNGDFADIVAYPPAEFKGIIALQVRNRPETIPLIMERLRDFLSVHRDMAYYAGKLILVDPNRIRIRER